MIKISSWVNTRTYLLNNSYSISFIEDIKNHGHYVLKGIYSVVWDLIFNLKDYTKICKQIKQNKIECNIDEFLGELKNKKIIYLKKELPIINNKFLTFKINEKEQNFNYFEKSINKILSENNFLWYLNLCLTYKCDLNCKHCFNPKNDKSIEISYRYAKKIIDEAYNFGLKEVCLTGGECTCNKNFLKIAKYIRKKHLRLYIISNGQSLYEDKEFFKKIINIYPSTIQLSLYSMDKNIHDNITRKKGSQKNILNLIEKLKAHNINIKITCFQTSYNYGEDISVKNYAHSQNIDFISGCTFIYNSSNHNLTAKLKKQQIIYYYMKEIDINNPRELINKNSESICSAGYGKLNISPSLDITPCNYFDFVLGNYKKISISEIIEKILPSFRERFVIKELKECFKHKYCKYCLFCPIYTMYENKNYKKKSKILCEDAQAYYEAYMHLKNK